jgi:hypothetical protein
LAVGVESDSHAVKVAKLDLGPLEMGSDLQATHSYLYYKVRASTLAAEFDCLPNLCSLTSGMCIYPHVEKTSIGTY